MKKQNFQYVTGLIVLGGVLYAAGAVNVLATFFETNPGAGYTCSSYDYFVGYGYGYDCTQKTGGGASSVSSTSSVTTTNSPENDTGSTEEMMDDESAENDTGSTEEMMEDDSAMNEMPTTETETDSSNNGDKEIEDAYKFGFDNGLTTLPLEEARLFEGLNRSELAKMMSNFIKNVEGTDATENPVCDITTYSDYATFDEEMKMYIKSACDYGIMGWKNDKSGLIEAFRPLDPVTREEFAAVLSRHLFGTMYDGQDMKAHLEALRDAGIMNQIDNPYVVEVRGYVLLMLQRTSQEEEVMIEDDSAIDTGSTEEIMDDESAENDTGSTEEMIENDSAMNDTGSTQA